MADQVGQQFGNYRLTQLLGRGGFAEVYLGEHIHLPTQVAIKILCESPSDKDLKNFKKEAQIVASLKHPNIVHVFDFGFDANNIPFFVMDYLPNGSILNIHPRGQMVSLKRVISYTRQVALALQHAHNARIIHRDVKPENLLLGPHQEVLLSDFGIAVMSHSLASMTSHNAPDTLHAPGTIHYMAPEQLQGKPHKASDQYALGIVIYEWLSGERPFQGDSNALRFQHMYSPPPSLCAKVPGLSNSVEQVVMRALAKDPQQRFANVQEFATALERACSPASHTSNRPASPSSQTLPPVSPIPPTQDARPTWLLSNPPVSQQPLAFPPTQAATGVLVPINTIPVAPPAVQPIPRSKWDSDVPPVGFSLAILMSWIIWIIVMCLKADYTADIRSYANSGSFFSLSGSFLSPMWSLVSLLSSIVLFFFWGWIIAQNSGEFGAGFAFSVYPGVFAMICASDICAAIDFYQTIGGSQGGIIAFLVCLVFGLLPSFVSLFIAFFVSLIPSALGSLFGRLIYQLLGR